MPVQVIAWFFKFESSGRGGAHCHGQVIQRAFQTQWFQDLVNHPDFREKMLAWAGSLMARVLPSIAGEAGPR